MLTETETLHTNGDRECSAATLITECNMPVTVSSVQNTMSTQLRVSIGTAIRSSDVSSCSPVPESTKKLHCARSAHSGDPLVFVFSVNDLSLHVSLIKRHPQPHVHSTDRTVLTVSHCAIPSFTRHLRNNLCYSYATLPTLAGPRGRAV